MPGSELTVAQWLAQYASSRNEASHELLEVLASIRVSSTDVHALEDARQETAFRIFAEDMALLRRAPQGAPLAAVVRRVAENAAHELRRRERRHREPRSRAPILQDHAPCSLLDRATQLLTPKQLVVFVLRAANVPRAAVARRTHVAEASVARTEQRASAVLAKGYRGRSGVRTSRSDIEAAAWPEHLRIALDLTNAGVPWSRAAEALATTEGALRSAIRRRMGSPGMSRTKEADQPGLRQQIHATEGTASLSSRKGRHVDDHETVHLVSRWMIVARQPMLEVTTEPFRVQDLKHMTLIGGTRDMFGGGGPQDRCLEIQAQVSRDDGATWEPVAPSLAFDGTTPTLIEAFALDADLVKFLYRFKVLKPGPGGVWFDLRARFDRE